MARIAIGGWQHETNTFATIKADYAAFHRADEWPPLATGKDLLHQVDGVHLPITGALAQFNRGNHEIVPLLWCSATPSAHVTEDAYERIAAMLIKAVRDSLPLDGLYLDLHGAMVCEHLEDGEGELLRRIRTVVGRDLPIAASLDLHANITPEMLQHADVLDVFRTYPHVDMGETGARAAMMLGRIIAGDPKPHAAFRQTGFLIALNWGCTDNEPCRSIYRRIPEVIAGDVLSASFASGFHLSDIHHVGPAAVAYARTPEAAATAADDIAGLVESLEDRFEGKVWTAADGVAQALKLRRDGAGTVVLADTQDNPGGGGAGDTTGLLEALVAGGAAGAVLGLLSDPDAAAAATDAGVGAEIEVALGGRSGLPGQSPYHCRLRVLALADGNFTATGPMYHGARMVLGRCALLETGGVRVIVSSKPVQAADQSMFRHLGIEPAREPIIALKSSVHFRNDFADLADAILVVEAPGAVHADPAKLHYQNKREGVRVLGR